MPRIDEVDCAAENEHPTYKDCHRMLAASGMMTAAMPATIKRMLSAIDHPKVLLANPVIEFEAAPITSPPLAGC
jgi:hypothetical protein